MISRSYRPISKSVAFDLTMLITLMLTSSNIFAQDRGHVRTNIGLIYPLSSNGVHASRDTNAFSLNLIAGVSAAEQGLTVAGVSNFVCGEAKGFQVAGVLNHIGGNAKGVTVAGLSNTCAGGSGVSIAGLTNIGGNNTGPQIAGIFNKGGNIFTLQVGGLINMANNLKGVQVAGLMNMAKRSTGIQIGFINMADSAATQIGIVNLARNGERSLGISMDETQTAVLSYRSGGRVFYGIIGAGYSFNNHSLIYAYQAGIGARLINFEKFRLKTELIASGLENFKGSKYFKSSSYLMPAFRFTKSVELFAGPSFNSIVTDSNEGRNLIKHYVSGWTSEKGHDFHGFYIGYTAGILVRL